MPVNDNCSFAALKIVILSLIVTVFEIELVDLILSVVILLELISVVVIELLICNSSVINELVTILLHVISTITPPPYFDTSNI